MPNDMAPVPLGRRVASPLALGLILSIILLAAALRLYRLDAQSLSGDEILTVYASQSANLRELRASSAGIDHPPLYFLLLKGWWALAGDSEFSLRYLSFGLSVVSITLLYQLVRFVSTSTAGLTVGILASMSPFFVYFGQENRGYALMLSLTILSSYLLARITAGGGGRYWLSWSVACIAAMYTEYVAVPVILAQDAFLFLLLLRGPVRLWRWWIISNGAIWALELPWLLAQRVVSEVYAHDSGAVTPLAQMVEATVSAFATGRTLEPLADWRITVPMLLVGALGLLYRGVAPPLRLSVLGYLLVPIAITYGVAASGVGFDPRHVVAAAPGFVILLAWGLLWMKDHARVLMPGGCLLLALPNLLYLVSYYFEPFSGRDDLRSGAMYIADAVRPGDVVVYNAPWGAEVFPYYAGTSFASIGLPQKIPLDAKQTVDALEELKSQHQRIWLVRWSDWWSDPGRFIQEWLERNTFPIGGEAYARVTVLGYLSEAPVLQQRPHIQMPMEAVLGGKVRFLGYEIDNSDVASKRRLNVALYWESLGSMDKSYKVFAHLVDSKHRVYGQRDDRPVYDRLPTDRWEAGSIVRDDRQIELRPGTPPGEYRVAVGMYEEGGERLSIVAGDKDYLLLGPVHLPRTVGPPDLDEFRPTFEIRKSYSDIELLGYDLNGAGRVRGAPWLEVLPGQSISALLLWRAVSVPERDHLVDLRLEDEEGSKRLQRLTHPVDGSYPTSQWASEEVVRDHHELVVPGDMPKGVYRILLSLDDGDPVELGKVKINERARMWEVPPMQQSLQAKMGDFVKLLGYDVAVGDELGQDASSYLAPSESLSANGGDSVRLTLYWKAVGITGTSYKAFTHLLDGDSRIWGQQDSYPLGGVAPTTSWLEGEVIADTYEFTVEEGVAPGAYVIEVGMYEPISAQRLPVAGGGDRVLLPTRLIVGQ